MEQVVIKREDSNGGDILLFFIDDNGVSEKAVLTTVNNSIQLQDNNSYVIEQHNIDESSIINFTQTPKSNEYTEPPDTWTYDEIHKLLSFYNSNKQVFLMGPSKTNSLWIMACKTMLLNKDPASCDEKLRNLKAEFIDLCKNKCDTNNDPILDLCKQVFSDDPDVKAKTESNVKVTKVEIINPQEFNSVSQKCNNSKTDEKVMKMLQLYLKYKKNFRQYFTGKLWELIASELEEEDGKYWHKRFLNYKQHYIWLLERRKDAVLDINWPYMALFDEIFNDDDEFRKKYPHISPVPIKTIPKSEKKIRNPNEWLETEKIALLKYNYDCFDDFQNPDIPNNFLWNEVGRLLDKNPEVCMKKYEELKMAHYENYLKGDYDLRNRKPLEILCDNVISKEIELEIFLDDSEDNSLWKKEEVHEMVQFFYDNIEMFKDYVCYYVCWGIIAKKLKRTVGSCRKHWEELVLLYKSILNDKKENPDMQIDWVYIDLFDRIFDYGMDINLLNGYEKLKEKMESNKICVKKINISMDKSPSKNVLYNESFDDTNTPKRFKRSSGDSKAFQILGYYQKYKDKLSTNSRNKHNVWTPLSREIGISETQCAHRLRNLKQVYTAYIQREINKPEMPILWPYYALCKKVFGYRALKNKLKNAGDSDYEEWIPSEIKQLINHFAENFDYITNNIEDFSIWTRLATNIDKNEASCKDKFIELRKSYRKLKTQITRNPNVKISWKYFNMFEKIYNTKDKQTNMDVDQDDEEYECIIVLPEDEDLSDINNTQIMQIESNLTDSQQTKSYLKKWTKRNKKLLLIHYIKYIRTHKDKEIKIKEMWKEIAGELNKTPKSCRKMFIKLKKIYKRSDSDDKTETPYDKLLEKVVKLRPKYAKVDLNTCLNLKTVFKNVELPTFKVKKALDYYLQHIEDFVNPIFDKKFMWTELANYICEPVTKVFDKINYLKQIYDSDLINKEDEGIIEMVKDIVAKEIAINLVSDIESDSVKKFLERIWSDEEMEQLLEWYLSNLDKFKNPKFVRSYLWMEISNILNRSPLDCSKKMSEIRTHYRNMVRDNSDRLVAWRFFTLCQKIYGTGKKGNVEKIDFQEIENLSDALN